MTNQNTYQLTAEQAYNNERLMLIANLEEITALLNKADASQARTPTSWGHVGNLGYANEGLDDIISFLS